MANPDLHVVQPLAQAPDGMSDDDLMRLVRAGHQGAFETVVRRHQELVARLAIRFLDDSALGRDVTQDVFMTLWAERRRYRPQGKFRSYLVSCTLHRCHKIVRHLRRSRRRMDCLKRDRLLDETVQQLPLEQVLQTERAREMRAGLTQLPPKYRDILLLRYTLDMSLQEIASFSGKPIGTVKSYLFRGVSRLYRILQEERP